MAQTLLNCLLLLSAAAAVSAGQRCPPAGFDSVPDFNLRAYIAGSWYPQQQIPLVYQQKQDLYCVKATYIPINPNNLTEGLRVYNYANRDKVNGEAQGINASLIALPASQPRGSTSATAASKLMVGPDSQLAQLAKSIAFGPYWIVATGPSSDPTLKYDWAVISGGPPNYCTGSGCSTFNPLLPSTMQYQGGLWLFTRKPVDPAGAAAAKAKAQELGFDTSALLPVTQEGCTYAGSKNV